MGCTNRVVTYETMLSTVHSRGDAISKRIRASGRGVFNWLARMACMRIGTAAAIVAAGIGLGPGSIRACGDTFPSYYELNLEVPGHPALTYLSTSPPIGLLGPESNNVSGTDAYGRQYVGSAKGWVALNGGDLYASASLSGGSPASPPSGFTQQPFFDIGIWGFVGSAPFYVSTSIVADGHGISTSGDGVAGGSWSVQFSNQFGDAFGGCSIAANGGYQTCSTGFAEDSTSFLSVAYQAGVTVTAPTTNDSASINYWGTFTVGPLQFYNSSGQPIGT